MERKFQKTAKTGLALLAGASALIGSNAYCQNEGAISWRGIPKNMDGSENYAWESGKTYKLEIWADNCTLNGQKTGAFYWRIGVPPQITLLSAEFTNDTNSFFYGMDMDYSIRIDTEGRNMIATLGHFNPYTGDIWANGVANKRGSIAVYTAKVDENAKPGAINFTFDQMEARSDKTNGIMSYPLIKPKICGVSVINSGNTKPVISLNSSWEDNYLVQASAQVGETNVLEKTCNLTDWTPVSTNTGSFTWADKDAETAGQVHNFYRAVKK